MWAGPWQHCLSSCSPWGSPGPLAQPESLSPASGASATSPFCPPPPCPADGHPRLSALCASFATCTSRWALSFSSPGFCLLWALRTGCHWWGDSVGPCVSWQEASRSDLWLRKGTLCL